MYRFLKLRFRAKFLIVLAGLGLIGTNIAVTAEEETSEMEEVVVTGSRIKRTTFESSSPLTVIDATDFEGTGATNVSDYLSKMPQNIASFNNSNTVFSNTISAVNMTDLRFLGTDRTLVLVNGRRYPSGLAPGSGYGVDLNSIPTSTIERIEILTGGTSAVYGSDAIAGVVNIITKTDFEGISVNIQSGTTESDKDRDREDFDVTIGGQFGNGGNAWMAFGYSNDDGLFSRDRDFSSTDIIAYDNVLFTPNTGTHWGWLGSSFPPGGRFGNYLGDGSPFISGLDDQANSSRFNRASFRMLAIPIERRFTSANVNYNFTDNLTVWGEMSWSLVETHSEFEPTPLDLNSNIFKTQKFANPSTCVADGLPCPPGHDVASSLLMPILLKNNLLADGITDLNQLPLNTTARRLVEFGARGSDVERTTVRIATGITYDFDNGMELDVHYGYGRTDQDQINNGDLNSERALLALDVELAPDGVTVQCVSAAARNSGCVPFNVFGAGTISPEAVAYLSAPSTFQAFAKQEYVGINLTGDLSSTLDLPGGPIGFAVGFEWREESGSDRNGALDIIGASSSNKLLPTDGRFNVNEIYGELRLPVHEKVAISLAARSGDYSTVGSQSTWMAGVEADIVAGLTFRATISESVRAPNISDLFAGEGETFATLTDACDGLNPLATDNVTLNCLSVPAIAARVIATGEFVLTQVEKQSTGGFIGGNPNVQEETADSLTVGFVWNPEFVEGLSLAIDYYDIEVDEAIIVISRGTVIRRCFDVDPGSFDPTCNGLSFRDPSSGALVEVDSGSSNELRLNTAGIDIELDYTRDVGPGTLGFNIVYNYLSEYELIGIKDGFKDDNVGEVATPENRFTGKITYNYNDLNVFWRFRWWDDVKDSNQPGVENGGVTADGTLGDLNNLDAIWYHDVQVNYDFADNYNIYAGINNLLDEEPPILGQGTQFGPTGVNTAAFAYDIYGRSTYIGIRANF